LDEVLAHGGGSFGREGLGSGDTEWLAVRAGIKIVLAQVACRELFEGLVADEACNGMFPDAIFPVFWCQCAFDLPCPAHAALKGVVFTYLEGEQASVGFGEPFLHVLWRKALPFDKHECQVFCHFGKQLCHEMSLSLDEDRPMCRY
jgi:hypothetical protein